MIDIVDVDDFSHDEDDEYNRRLNIFYSNCFEWIQSIPRKIRNSLSWHLVKFIQRFIVYLSRHVIAVLIFLLSAACGIFAGIAYKDEWRIVIVFYCFVLFVCSFVSFACKKGTLLILWENMPRAIVEQESNLMNIHEMQETYQPTEYCTSDEKRKENSLYMLEQRTQVQDGPCSTATETFEAQDDAHGNSSSGRPEDLDQSQICKSASNVRTFLCPVEVHHVDSYSPTNASNKRSSGKGLRSVGSYKYSNLSCVDDDLSESTSTSDLE